MINKNKPLLTIAVPTYNRPKNLRSLFHDFLKKADNQFDGLVEIIVFDNSDIEESKKNKKTLKNSKIKYFKNSENVGFTINVINCFKKAQGNYLWIVSDDDHINFDAFNNLISKLECFSNNKYDGIMLPFLSSDGYGKKYISNNYQSWNVEQLSTIEELIKNNNQLPFVLFSSAIINMSNLNLDRLVTITNQFQNNDYIQIPLFLEAITKKGTIFFYNEVLIEYISSREVRFNISNMMNSMKQLIVYYISPNETHYKKYMTRNYRSYVGLCLMHRAKLYKVNGADSFRGELIKDLKASCSINNIILTCLLYCPSGFLNLLYKLNNFIRFRKLNLNENNLNIG